MWCGEKCAPLPGSDVRLLLHAVRDSANELGSELYGTLLPAAPAVAVGHSLGGAGSLIATSRDEDFEGAFVMSPCVVHSETLASISKPIMVLSATEDGICPPAQRRARTMRRFRVRRSSTTPRSWAAPTAPLWMCPAPTGRQVRGSVP